jgi:ATP-dependent RNA helicase DDX56/DBP9
VEYIIATDEALQAAAAVDTAAAADADDAADAADDGNDNAGEGSSGKKKKGKRAPAKDKEYGVARGVDFQGADTVINFELPADAMMCVWGASFTEFL